MAAIIYIFLLTLDLGRHTQGSLCIPSDDSEVSVIDESCLIIQPSCFALISYLKSPHLEMIGDMILFSSFFLPSPNTILCVEI